MTPGRIRALIVDDEPMARAMIRKFLEEDPDIELAGECADGCSAVEAIEAKTPDLVFLDVQMPELDGFGVLRALEGSLPNVIFVTAYDKFALDAFAVHAIDYLLKPFDRERFFTALEQGKQMVAYRRFKTDNERLARLLSDQAPQRLARVLVKYGGRAFFVPISEITWVEAQGNYIELHVDHQHYLLRQTLSAFEKQLDPERFRRIQRSAIVNFDAVREIYPAGRGEYILVLRDGTELKLNQTFRESFTHATGGKL